MTATSAPLPALSVLPHALSVCRLSPTDPTTAWAGAGAFSSITRTPDELSIVCESIAAPSDVRAEHGWRALAVAGPLDFGLVGIMAGITGSLAAAGISVFVVSTYDTDYVLVRAARFDHAIAALQQAGYRVTVGPAETRPTAGA